MAELEDRAGAGGVLWSGPRVEVSRAEGSNALGEGCLF